MNKFLKASQEHNAEIMREMKTMNQNMSACFTTMSMALNKLAGKIDSSGPVKVSTNSNRTSNPITPIKQTQSYLSNSSSLATSSSLKPSQAEEEKIQKVLPKSDLANENDVPKSANIAKESEVNSGNSESQASAAVPQDPIIKEETNSSAIQDVDEIITIAADVNSKTNSDVQNNNF
jgi:hypothetical protein